ncbi:MAG: ABC transporter ATP-binding protein [Actinomycetota bacterium]
MTVAAGSSAKPRMRFSAVTDLIASLRPVASLLRPYRRWVAGVVAINVGIHIATIAAAVVGATLVGRAITGSPAAELRPLIWAAIALLVPLGVLGWLETVVTHVMSFRLIHDLRLVLYKRFSDLAPAYLLNRRSGDVTRASMADAELIEVFTSHIAPPLVAAFVVPGLALGGLSLIHWALVLVVLPYAVAVASVPTWLLKRARAQGDALRTELGELGANVVDTVQGTREILLLNASEAALERVRNQHRRILRASVAHGRRSGVEQASTDTLVALASISTLATAALLVVQQVIPAADFPAALLLAAGAFAPLVSVSASFREVGQVAAAADRIQALLVERPTVIDTVERAPLMAAQPAAPPAVSFAEVRFSYGPGLPEVLHGTSFEIRPGETVALVGPSGAGKSTCANLLLRLWDVSSGAITIGGHDVRAFPQKDLRQMMAVVPQDVFLFNTTVRENIRMGRPDATDADVERAAEQAQALELIHALPEGWNTVLGERGATLSGGQRQRIAIARALLRNAGMLVMDEAVSNLDAESERAVHAALSAVRSQRTTLLIAHRPSTIRLADRIVVLDSGRVVESGTYQELHASGGALWTLLGSG